MADGGRLSTFAGWVLRKALPPGTKASARWRDPGAPHPHLCFPTLTPTLPEESAPRQTSSPAAASSPLARLPSPQNASCWRSVPRSAGIEVPSGPHLAPNTGSGRPGFEDQGVVDCRPGRDGLRGLCQRGRRKRRGRKGTGGTHGPSWRGRPAPPCATGGGAARTSGARTWP